MIKLLRKFLILLLFSVLAVSAQDVAADSDCNVKFSECIDKCSETDEACMSACDAQFPCPEDEEEVTPES